MDERVPPLNTATRDVENPIIPAQLQREESSPEQAAVTGPPGMTPHYTEQFAVAGPLPIKSTLHKVHTE